MALDYDRLMAAEIPPLEQHYDARDQIIYALAVGLGADPTDERQLRFLYERDLLALPTAAATVAWTRFSDLDLGLPYGRILHSEQRMVLHRPLAPTGHVITQLRVKEVVDRGAEKGAILYFERTVRDKPTDELISIQLLTIFARTSGGFGGPPREMIAPHPIPTRAPDLICTLKVSPRSALLYRLTGDVNPLHIDPTAAKAMGFERPILHGMATYGVMGHALLEAVLDYDPARLLELDVRFSAPVIPGDEIRTELWIDGEIVSLRASVPDRDVTVINNGRARIIAKS